MISFSVLIYLNGCVLPPETGVGGRDTSAALEQGTALSVTAV